MFYNVFLMHNVNVVYVPRFCCSSRRRHTRCYRDWSSDVCSSDLSTGNTLRFRYAGAGNTSLVFHVEHYSISQGPSASEELAARNVRTLFIDTLGQDGGSAATWAEVFHVEHFAR